MYTTPPLTRRSPVGDVLVLALALETLGAVIGVINRRRGPKLPPFDVGPLQQFVNYPRESNINSQSPEALIRQILTGITIGDSAITFLQTANAPTPRQRRLDLIARAFQFLPFFSGRLRYADLTAAVQLVRHDLHQLQLHYNKHDEPLIAYPPSVPTPNSTPAPRLASGPAPAHSSLPPMTAPSAGELAILSYGLADQEVVVSAPNYAVTDDLQTLAGATPVNWEVHRSPPALPAQSGDSAPPRTLTSRPPTSPNASSTPQFGLGSGPLPHPAAAPPPPADSPPGTGTH